MKERGKGREGRTLQHLEPNHQPTVVAVAPTSRHGQSSSGGDTAGNEEEDSGGHRCEVRR